MFALPLAALLLILVPKGGGVCTIPVLFAIPLLWSLAGCPSLPYHIGLVVGINELEDVEELPKVPDVPLEAPQETVISF